MLGMQKTLADWKKSDSGNEGWLAADGYYLCAEAGGKAAGAPPATTLEGPVLPDPVSGQIGGLPFNPNRFDRPLLSQAVSCWRAALEADPWRLDVRFSLAWLYADMGDFDAQYDLLAQTLQMSDKGWRNLEWLAGEKLPRRSSKLITRALQGYIAFCFDLKTKDRDEDARQMARLAITFYPHWAEAYRDLSTFFARRQDWPRAVKYLLIANQKAPKDSSILCAIGDTLDQLGKKKEAKIFYRRVIELNNNEASMERAREQLGLKKE